VVHGWYCLTLVLLSTGFGFIWQGRAAAVGLGLGLLGYCVSNLVIHNKFDTYYLLY